MNVNTAPNPIQDLHDLQEQELASMRAVISDHVTATKNMLSQLEQWQIENPHRAATRLEVAQFFGQLLRG